MSAAKKRGLADNGFVRWLGSYGLCVTILILLFVLTVFGTWDQRKGGIGLHASIQKYFNSYWFTVHVGRVVIPLPGAVSLMTLLAANLFVGGFLRIQKSTRTIGVLVIHAGIAMLLLAGLVKRMSANEGYVSLYEGQEATVYRSYHDWEVSVRELLPDEEKQALTSGEEWFVHQDVFEGLDGEDVAIVDHPELPFDLHLRHFSVNARVYPEAPGVSSVYPLVDGYRVIPLKAEEEAERNFAAIYCDVVPKGSTTDVRGDAGILAAMERYPYTVVREGRMFAIELRKRRYPMPFSIELEKFTMEEHPRTRTAAEFSSDVLARWEQGSEGDPFHISMNKPLREDGLVVFQSKYGPSNAKPGTPLFSVFAVVRNPSDRWPEYSCWVIAAGMLIAFGQRLTSYIKRQKDKLRGEVTQ